MTVSPKSVKSAPAAKGVTKAQLRAAEADLRAFRHDVAVLKKKGLIDKHLYDARSVRPGKYILGQIKKFREVLDGKAATPKVSKAKAKYYRDKGYTVKNNRVIVPIAGNEKVYSTGGDFRVKFQGSNGSITKIDLGLDRHNVTQWLDDLRHNKFKPKKDEVLTFQLMGHNATDRYGYSDRNGKTAQERMADKLESYKIFEEAIRKGDPNFDQELIDGLVILKVKRNPDNPWVEVPEHFGASKMSDYEIEQRNEFKRRRSVRRMKREARMTGEEFNDMMDTRAEQKRKERARMTPEQKMAYKEAGKLRAARSYANRKK